MPGCNARSTVLLRHREAGPYVCDHLVCDAHKNEGAVDHDFVALHVVYPMHFAATGTTK